MLCKRSSDRGSLGVQDERFRQVYAHRLELGPLLLVLCRGVFCDLIPHDSLLTRKPGLL